MNQYTAHTSTPIAPHMATITYTFEELCAIHVALHAIGKARPEFAVRHASIITAAVDRTATGIMVAA